MRKNCQGTGLTSESKEDYLLGRKSAVGVRELEGRKDGGRYVPSPGVQMWLVWRSRTTEPNVEVTDSRTLESAIESISAIMTAGPR